MDKIAKKCAQTIKIRKKHANKGGNRGFKLFQLDICAHNNKNLKQSKFS